MAIVRVSLSVLVHVWGNDAIYEENKVQASPLPARLESLTSSITAYRL